MLPSKELRERAASRQYSCGWVWTIAVWGCWGGVARQEFWGNRLQKPLGSGIFSRYWYSSRLCRGGTEDRKGRQVGCLRGSVFRRQVEDAVVSVATAVRAA